MAFEALQWHKGELEIHSLLSSPEKDNPTSPCLTPFAASLIPQTPLLAIGTLDASSHPWTSIWAGPPGFSRPISRQVMGARTMVDMRYDPVVNALFGEEKGGEVVQGGGKLLSGLNVDLETRRRVKVMGRFAAGAVAPVSEGVGEVQMAIHIDQSLGNCPKYLNKRTLSPHTPTPELISNNLPLSTQAIAQIQNTDLFFLSTSHHNADMDTNHRGGSPDFIRILSNTPEKTILVWPEYSGNRLYQTLGNLHVTPRAGLTFPDFVEGNVLYTTGTTEILIGDEAARVLPRCKLAVKYTVEAAVHVANALNVRAETENDIGFSPYNPPLRFLATESPRSNPASKAISLRITAHRKITPSIAHITFTSNSPLPPYKKGQYALLSLAKELDLGYSHMADDDPQRLNEDYLRNFTVISHTPSPPSFSILMRNTRGTVTKFLYNLDLRVRADVEVECMGFEGGFGVDDGEGCGFIGAGIGITPLLAAFDSLHSPDNDEEGGIENVSEIKIIWTLRKEDLDVVTFVCERYPALKGRIELFITNATEGQDEISQRVGGLIKDIRFRRVEIRDVAGLKRCCVCVGKVFEGVVRAWVEEGGGEVLSEDFGY